MVTKRANKARRAIRRKELNQFRSYRARVAFDKWDTRISDSSSGSEDEDEVSPSAFGREGFSDDDQRSESDRSTIASSFDGPSDYKALQELYNQQVPSLPKGRMWTFSLFPLSGKEKRIISKKNHWFKLKETSEGDYSVAPNRDDMTVFQRKYWIYRELKQSLAVIRSNLSEVFREDLKWIRRTIFKKLGNGSKQRTKEQSSLLAETYWYLRYLDRLSDAEKALLE